MLSCCFFRGEVQNESVRYSKRSYKEVTKTFRDSFGKLSTLRTALSNSPVLALTSTANSLTEKKIAKSLAMKSFSLIRHKSKQAKH